MEQLKLACFGGKMALAPSVRVSDRLTKKDKNDKTKMEYDIMVQPPFNNALVSSNEDFWSKLKSTKNLRGRYQFGRNVYASPQPSQELQDNEFKAHRDIGYAIVCVAKWSDKQIKLNSVQLGSSYKRVSHPGGRAMEIISTYWMSKCLRFVLLPPTTHVLDEDFLTKNWLPQSFWSEHSIRPPDLSKHYFQRDREYFLLFLFYVGVLFLISVHFV